MSLFDDDPFEDIVRQFFGQGVPAKRRDRETVIDGEEEDRVIDFVEGIDKVYLVFELPGYGERDVVVVVKGKELEIKAQKKNGEKMQDYLMQKLHRGIFVKKNLPDFINSKKFSHTMRNGILEVAFGKR
jgi:HSP20 family molecular chaperone IbpA